ncbi:MAG: hypothetical protein RJA81_1530 [Planctomycetota bacterium]|jgi:hypothetical protein
MRVASFLHSSGAIRFSFSLSISIKGSLKMQFFLRICLLFSLLLITGCGGSSSVPVVQEIAQSKPGLNGGVAFPLPENTGYVEVLVERSKPGQPVIFAAYFLNAAADGPAASEPSAVTAQLVLPTEDQPKDVTLTKQGKKGGDKAVGVRFASVPGAYAFDELSGEITVTLDGKPLVVPFAMR